MTPKMRKKINQIRNDIIPKGYTFTEAGIIPVDWDYARLSDISEQITQTAGTEKYETVSISAGIGFVNQAKKFGKELSGKQYAKYTVLHKGDFSYNKGNSKKYPQGCVYRLKDRETAAVPNVFESFLITTGCAEYYDQLFVSGYLNHQLYRLINHGVRDDGLLNLTHKDFYSCLLPVPPLSEQEKIAKILSAQDKVIECYEKKIEQLKRMKKYYLQNMFPKRGETVPKIRFKGFTDPWEKRKLSDIVERITRKNQDLVSELPLTISAQYGLIDQNEFFDKRIASKDVRGYYLVKNGEFAYNKSTSADAPWGAVKRLDKYGMGVLSTLYIVFRIIDENTDSDFLVTFYDTNLWHNGVQAVAAEGARNHGLLNISAYDFLETSLTLPQEVEEQRLIGTYFKSLDNLITLHQRKLEEEKKKKKALQQLLLTGVIRTN